MENTNMLSFYIDATDSLIELFEKATKKQNESLDISFSKEVYFNLIDAAVKQNKPEVADHMLLCIYLLDLATIKWDSDLVQVFLTLEPEEFNNFVASCLDSHAIPVTNLPKNVYTKIQNETILPYHKNAIYYILTSKKIYLFCGHQSQALIPAQIYYHGTSTYHLDTIMKNGFGGQSYHTNSEMIYNMIDELYDLCISHNLFDDFIIDKSNVNLDLELKDMTTCDNEVLKEIISFFYNTYTHKFSAAQEYEYNSVYLTNSIERAVRYSCGKNSTFSSILPGIGELLQVCLILYCDICKYLKIQFTFSKDEMNQYVFDLIDTTKFEMKSSIKPVVLVINQTLCKNKLVSDEGTPLSQQCLRELVDDNNLFMKRKNAQSSQESFRYIGPSISISDITIITGESRNDLGNNLIELQKAVLDKTISKHGFYKTLPWPK